MILRCLNEQYYFGRAPTSQNIEYEVTCSELSQDAFQFFKLFLKHKSKFERPTVSGHYRPYDYSRNVHKEWPAKSWDADTNRRLALGVIDCRSLLSIEKKESSIVDNPYFLQVISSMRKTKKPALEDVPSWLFICGDEKEQAQVVNFIEIDGVLKFLSIAFSIYSTGKYNRLGDVRSQGHQRKCTSFFGKTQRTRSRLVFRRNSTAQRLRVI